MCSGDFDWKHSMAGSWSWTADGMERSCIWSICLMLVWRVAERWKLHNQWAVFPTPFSFSSHAVKAFPIATSTFLPSQSLWIATASAAQHSSRDFITSLNSISDIQIFLIQFMYSAYNAIFIFPYLIHHHGKACCGVVVAVVLYVFASLNVFNKNYEH